MSAPTTSTATDLARLSAEPGWRVDDNRQALPGEPPGPPLPGGTWERARELMLRCEFADPRIVRAVYAPDSPLAERDGSSSSASTWSRGPRGSPTPIVRLGFRIFGRRQQIRFARRALERMCCLVAGEPVRSAAEEVMVAVQPAQATTHGAGGSPRTSTGTDASAEVSHAPRSSA